MTSTEWFQAVKDSNLTYITTHLNELSCCIDEHGETALMCAVRLKNIDLIKLLVEHESRCTNTSGQSALIISIIERFQDAVELLLPHEYSIGTIPGQLNPLDVAIDSGDNDILTMVRNYENKSSEKDCSTNLITSNQEIVISNDMENNETTSHSVLPLSPDRFKTIGIPACRPPADSEDFEFCKIAIWRLANKALQSQDEFEAQFMAIQRKLERIILKYKQKVRILQKVLELAGVDEKSFRLYLKQIKNGASPQTISICNTTQLDSTLIPSVGTSNSDLRTLSNLYLVGADASTASEGLTESKQFLDDMTIAYQSDVPVTSQANRYLVENTHSINTVLPHHHSQIQSTTTHEIMISPQYNFCNIQSDKQLQLATNNQLDSNKVEPLEGNQHNAVHGDIVERLAVTHLYHDRYSTPNILGGESDSNTLELQLKLLSEDINDLNNVIGILDEHLLDEYEYDL